jgi:hypothetical protein
MRVKHRKRLETGIARDRYEPVIRIDQSPLCVSDSGPEKQIRRSCMKMPAEKLKQAGGAISRTADNRLNVGKIAGFGPNLIDEGLHGLLDGISTARKVVRMALAARPESLRTRRFARRKESDILRLRLARLA